MLIDGFACFHIGANGIKLHRVLIKGLVVEDIVLGRYHMIAKFCIVQVARFQPRLPTAVATVACKLLVVTYASTWLHALPSSRR